MHGMYRGIGMDGPARDFCEEFVQDRANPWTWVEECVRWRVATTLGETRELSWSQEGRSQATPARQEAKSCADVSRGHCSCVHSLDRQRARARGRSSGMNRSTAT